MKYKLVDIELKQKDYLSIEDFFNNRDKGLSSICKEIDIDNYDILITFTTFKDKSFNSDDKLDVLIYSKDYIDENNSTKDAFLKADNVMQLKHICFNLNDEVTYIFNLKNISNLYYDITKSFTCYNNANIIKYMLSITDFFNELDLLNFCNSLYDDIDTLIKNETLNKKNINLILNKFFYFGFEETSTNITYHKLKLSTLSINIKDICSFIIYCLKTILKTNNVDFIKSEIKNIDY